MAFLEVTAGPEKGRKVPLSSDDAVIFGRDTSCTFQLTDVLSSRRHFQIVFRDSQFVLEDLGSSNGTVLNEEKVSKQVLKTGDEVRIGETVLRFDGSPPAKTRNSTRSRRPADPLINTVIGGYKIEEFIGQGGMGTVYRATQISLNRTVALKILANRLTSDKKFIDMFIKEARAAGALNHPNIVQVYDVAEEKGMHFFSMELMTHGSVGEKLKELGKLSAPKALEMIIHAAKGLEYAEKKDLVHCDIKPDNLMITEDGTIKIGDLGLSKNLQRDVGGDENEVVFGTPHFIAPEQAQKHKVDHRADIYSLGAAFYLCLTGQTPYQGDSGREIALKHVREPLTPVKEVNEEIPDSLDSIVTKMMAKDPKDRYQSATKLLLDLRKANIEINPAAAYTDGFPGIPITDEGGGMSRLLVPVLLIGAILIVIILAALGVFSGETPDDGPGTSPVPDNGNGPDRPTGPSEEEIRRKKEEEEKRRKFEADKKKFREEQASTAYGEAVKWEKKHGKHNRQTLVKYQSVADRFKDTEAGKRAAARASKISTEINRRRQHEDNAAKELARLEGKANLLMKDLYFGKALAALATFPKEKFKKTDAASKLSSRLSFVRQKTASTYSKISSEASVALSQGNYKKARELYQGVMTRFEIATYLAKARKAIRKIDADMKRLKERETERILGEDVERYKAANALSTAKVKAYLFTEGVAALAAVLPGGAKESAKLTTQNYIQKAEERVAIIKNLSRLFRQVIVAIKAKSGRIRITIAKTQKTSGSSVAKILEADEVRLKIQVGRGKTSIPWSDLDPVEYHELILKALDRSPESNLLFAVHCLFFGGDLISKTLGYLEEAGKSKLPPIRKEAAEYRRRLLSGASEAGKEIDSKARALYKEFCTLFLRARVEPDPDSALKLLQKAKDKLADLKARYGHTRFVKELGK